MNKGTILGVTVSLLLVACGGSAATETSVVATVSEPTTTVPTTTTTTTTTTEAQAFPERFGSGELFEFNSVDAVIRNGPDGAWDWQYTDPGAVVVHDGSVHVFQNGFVGWPAPVGVGYWRSDDGGSTFVEVSDDPVFDGTDLEYVGRAALASSAVVLDDGTWVLYFYTWDAAGWPVAPSVIGRATAPGPLGPWVADAEPVLRPGDEGAWDGLFVRSPSVVRTDDGFEMFFAGGTRETQMIGRATSADGISWRKHDDPETDSGLFADSDPVLRPGDPREGNVWDQRNVFQPRVVRTSDGYVMSYASATDVTSAINYVRKLGLARSPDGINWDRSLGAIVATGEINAGAFYFASLAFIDDRYLLFVEAGKDSETEVYLATEPAPLP